jgi:hypothetical protein
VTWVAPRSGDGWPRCSYVADAAHDRREGTAPPADRWFLMEHPGPWGRIPVTQSGLDPATVTAVLDWTRENDGRVLLIRRPSGPGRVPSSSLRRWYRVDSRPGHESIRTGTVADERDLRIGLHDHGDPHDGPLQLVCAHGRHDTCCAVRGRPLAAALAATDPDGTWECSHIGGCRFAPALVLLPHGFTFGGVPVGEAAALVKSYAGGVLDSRWLRGRTSYPPVVQAAQHHARAITGAPVVDALRARSATMIGPSRWRVTLAEPDCVVELAEHHVETGRPLTCAATLPGRMRVFDLLSFTAG